MPPYAQNPNNVSEGGAPTTSAWGQAFVHANLRAKDTVLPFPINPNNFKGLVGARPIVAIAPQNYNSYNPDVVYGVIGLRKFYLGTPPEAGK